MTSFTPPHNEYARLCSYPGSRVPEIELFLSSKACRKYFNESHRKIDIDWVQDRYIVLTRPGKLRTLSRSKQAWMTVSLGAFVRQHQLPTGPRRLSIVDDIDGQLWIDVFPEPLPSPVNGSGSVHVNFKGAPDFKMTSTLDSLVKEAAKEDDSSMSQWIRDTLEMRLEDHYPHLWHSIKQ